MTPVLNAIVLWVVATMFVAGAIACAVTYLFARMMSDKP